MGVGGSKPTIEELLKENKNAIRTSIREIDREQRRINQRKKEVEALIKKSAKNGRIVRALFSL